MTKKLITLRKISTGGTLIIEGKSAKDVIKAKDLDPTDWEIVEPRSESEVDPDGDNQGDARPEDN